jgi:hypothetical protein
MQSILVWPGQPVHPPHHRWRDLEFQFLVGKRAANIEVMLVVDSEPVVEGSQNFAD